MKKILRNVQSCIVNQMDKKYRESAKTNYIKLVPLYGTRKVPDREFDFSSLFIKRTLLDQESGKQITQFENDIYFISGPAGIGKTNYISQIREEQNEDTVTIVLSCQKFFQSDADVYEAMYKEFCN